jgi:hypothetical protein
LRSRQKHGIYLVCFPVSHVYGDGTGFEEAEDVVPQVNENLPQIGGGVDTVGDILECLAEIEVFFELGYLGLCLCAVLVVLIER